MSALLLTTDYTGHTVKRCKVPIAEDAGSGGWDSGAAVGGGAAGGWDTSGGGDAAAATGSWADDAEGTAGTATWGDSGAGGW